MLCVLFMMIPFVELKMEESWSPPMDSR